MLRIGNQRSNEVIDANVNMVSLMNETSVEGVEIDTPEDLARAKKLWK